MYRGPDAVCKLLKALQKEECDILKKLKHVEPMRLRPADEASFKTATLMTISNRVLITVELPTMPAISNTKIPPTSRSFFII